METAESVATRHKPRPAVTNRPVRLRRWPARFLETIQVRRLINRNSAARACCCTACCDVTAVGSCQSGCSTRAVKTYRVVGRSLSSRKFAFVRSVNVMPRSSIFRSQHFASSSASSKAGSGHGMALDTSLGVCRGRSAVPPAVSMDAGDGTGVSNPAPVVGSGNRQGGAGVRDSAGGPIRRHPGTNRTAPTVAFPQQTCPDCTDKRVFRTRSSYAQHIKQFHGRYWNKRGWFGPIGRPADRRPRDGASPRATPPASRAAGSGTPAGATPPRAALAGASLPRTVVLRDPSPHSAASGALAPHADAAGALAPRAAASGALAPRAGIAEALAPRAASSVALVPRSTLPDAVEVPPQRTVVTTVPTRTGIPAGIGVLPPPNAAVVTLVTAFRPFARAAPS